ncbi:RNA ligase family protein [Halorussus halophilus]|uniref:RNA ligase family protein n=1 Tax=Halorussus halophilus TaxID=2650975 RepID=UPI001301531F|nr:RNA ligase family protein [Halorussus halophilus]
MNHLPAIPQVEDAPSGLLDGGHLWIQEYVDGAQFQFRLLESGLLKFGDGERTFDAEDVPAPYRHAVRHVRERLDRQALRDATAEVESVVFGGVATHRHSIDYDWDALPSVLGYEVWSDEKGGFFPPDVAEQIYARLGLDSVNTFEKEVRATDFDPDSYELPQSNWYDGPAAGVVLRSKTGERAKLLGATATGSDPTPLDGSPEEIAREFVTEQRVEAVSRKLESEGRPATFDSVFERLFEAIVREEHRRLFHRETNLDVQAFRSAVAERTRTLVG